MPLTQLPPRDEMIAAFLERDAAYEGLFLTAVRTTGVFCRPTCSARKPRSENVEFFASAREALASGFRPCKRCRPMQPAGRAPDWLAPLLDALERDPARRWTDADLRGRSLDPGRVRRWFQSQHGMTFHAYQRSRRLGLALGRIRSGDDLTQAAFAHGFESESGFREAFEKHFGAPPGRSRHRQLVVVNRLATPLGPMVAAACDEGVCLAEFSDRRMLETQIHRLQRRRGCAIAPGHHAHLARLEEELGRYFAGDLCEFTVPLAPAGTEFQHLVWDALRRIPCGETTSYAALARALGRPSAVRAVGRANGDNPLAIVVPCHRVVGSNGELTGYGGGLWRKRALLELERGGA